MISPGFSASWPKKLSRFPVNVTDFVESLTICPLPLMSAVQVAFWYNENPRPPLLTMLPVSVP